MQFKEVCFLIILREIMAKIMQLIFRDLMILLGTVLSEKDIDDIEIC